ncbi:hypothetical protein [Agromyces larvae]|uniref:Uncharacterized protein n=1 Tax=Agromyces larvae TaxID=2929802 RepID=A0ABY4C794_9MICO|nr:hypothetical protein [Agromyces larvae]UOE45971.1 hypothetical protein MTO99_09580 [Agromyces larvae]
MQPDDSEIQPGDHVTIATRRDRVVWDVVAIESRIDPLGVLLRSGLTGRHRRESAANLHLFQKGTP